MKTQHTQGPWDAHSNNEIHPLWDEDGLHIIAEIPEDAQQSEQEKTANARLIAAAPDLLQMVYDLKKCIERLTEDGVSQFDRDKEAEWIGEAHELLLKVNPYYYNNANS